MSRADPPRAAVKTKPKQPLFVNGRLPSNCGCATSAAAWSRYPASQKAGGHAGSHRRVRVGSSALSLSALRDEWYQDVSLGNLGEVLRNGAEWYADNGGGRWRWSLAGRDLYVLEPAMNGAVAIRAVAFAEAQLRQFRCPVPENEL